MNLQNKITFNESWLLVVDLPRQSRILLLAANSTDNQQDQPMVESQELQRGVSGNTQISPASVEHLKQIARNLDMEGQPSQIDATETQISPASVEHLKQIARNLDMEGQPLQIDANETNDSFLDSLPGNLRDVLGNSACLFKFFLSSVRNLNLCL